MLQLMEVNGVRKIIIMMKIQNYIPLLKNVLIEKLKSLAFKYVHPRSLHLKDLKNYMKKIGIII